MAARRVPSGGGSPARYLPLRSPLANGKKGRKATPALSHHSRTPSSGSRWRMLYWFCTLTKPGLPSGVAAAASSSRSTVKLEQPNSRTLPSATSSASVPMVSAIGVFWSGRCSW